MGAPPVGQALKKVVAKILDFLNNSAPDVEVPETHTLAIQIPKFEMSKELMAKPINDMNDPDFWLQ